MINNQRIAIILTTTTYSQHKDVLFAQLDENNVVTQVIVVSNDTHPIQGLKQKVSKRFRQKLLVLIPTGSRPHTIAT